MIVDPRLPCIATPSLDLGPSLIHDDGRLGLVIGMPCSRLERAMTLARVGICFHREVAQRGSQRYVT